MEHFVVMFACSITLHNLEEALWLPAWSRHAAKFHKPVKQAEFHFAVIVITILAYLSVFLFLLFPSSAVAKFVLVGFLGAMIVNAIFPHLVATIVLKRYAPGLLTGVLLNIPINSTILYQFFQKGDMTLGTLVLSTVTVGMVLLGLIPVLFRMGGAIARQIN